MRRVTGILAVLLLFGAIVSATGVVMERNRRMSLFLQARDRIEAGHGEVALARLGSAIDWPAEDAAAARRLARSAVPSLADRADLRAWRAGSWALLAAGSRRVLLSRERSGFRAVR